MCFTSETHYHNSIYTIGCADNFIDDEGKYVHFLHLFANDDLQPLPDGARAFPTVIIAASTSSFRALQSITGYHCIVTVKDIALGPSDTLITTDDSSSSILI
ncbi:hypothetical protein C8R48DRAFT_677056 [Suillus tomentosus]|nr:hypothetical protein C8R48DRAFT_677056 [Suillus tomentosus]